MKKINEPDNLAVNTIRFLAVDAVEEANSGHPGLPMGGAGMAYALWSRLLKHSPSHPDWPDRDRFILSAGHGSMLLYALLHLFGYDLTLNDIKDFRQWGSRTPGHPEYGHTPGVEVTTGPLGQGFASAVGMALAERRLAAEFNRPGFPVVDHCTYIYAGDGCMMEGVTAEAASLAGHLKLGKLICLYDDNKVTIDGSTDITFTENVAGRFTACGWQVVAVGDGNDLDRVEEAVMQARKDPRPSLVMVRTEIGYGSPNKQGKPESHGAPLGPEEARLTKEKLGWPIEPKFLVPDEVREYLDSLKQRLDERKEEWDYLMDSYRKKFPDLASSWDAWHAGGIPDGLADDSSLWEFDGRVATRSASGKVLQKVAGRMTNLVGGSADLNASTKTYLEGYGDFQAGNPAGNNIAFGVREHAMAAVLSGITLHGGLRAFGSTFLVFFDYMKPSVRLAALMGVPAIYVFTHDSIAVGEDGPTHQPVEHLANMRSIPNLHVLRPADGRETAAAWLHALKRMEGPTALVLTRQDLPQLPGTGPEAFRGAYIVGKENGQRLPDAILLASGSEVSVALEAKNILEEKGYNIRVVSMPGWELFDEQGVEYREKILPGDVPVRLAVEAALPMGWERYTGSCGGVIGVDNFGTSAPGNILMEKAGFNPPAVAARLEELIRENTKKQ